MSKKQQDYIEIKVKKLHNTLYDGIVYNVYLITCNDEYVATVRYDFHKDMILKELVEHNKKVKAIITNE